MPYKNNSNPNKLILNRYRIIKKIASGGMADVYLGMDLKLNRQVAIKILSANYANNKNFVERFKREAQILAKLNDPNIVAVHDWGKFDSSYFICMEYIKGQSLKEIIEKKGIINPKIAANYAIQICSALEVAHRNDLIHRDIKPQNILITPEGVVKITDFGIAKSLNTDITKTLNIIGTAHYISPEQAQGKILDCRTDIYSSGIVIYEMLTADIPFRGENSIDISLKHVSDMPLKPSKLISSIPIKLEKIVMHCLEKNPSKRYISANELKNDLQNFLDNRPLIIDDNRYRKKHIHIFNRIYDKTNDKHTYDADNIFYPEQSAKKLKLNYYNILPYIFILLFLTLFIIFSIKYYNLENEQNLVIVPPIEKVSVENAEKILSAYGLNLIIKDRVYSSDTTEDFIIKQSPQSKSNVSAGSEVEVVVSKGVENEYILMPNVIGLSLEYGSKILKEYGLEVESVSKICSEDFDKDIIIYQEPEFNEKIDTGTAINLTVSLGEKTIIIPNIVGLDYLYASSHLESLGLIVKESKKPDSECAPGIVTEIYPFPGTEVKENSLVEIIVSTTEQLILVPDISRINLDEAESILNSNNINYEISYIDTNYSVQKGLVIDQDPEAGTYISAGSLVTLYIGK